MGIGNIASSGINAALKNMESISNNIANVNTIGYKKTFVNFADIFAGGNAGGKSVGLGTRVQGIEQNFSMGRIESSQSGLDLRLTNDGFFIQKDPVMGQVSYTRAGRLEVNNEGYIIGYNGVLQGYPATDGVVSATGNLTDLKIPTDAIPAKATDSIGLQINLDSQSEVIANPFDKDDPDTYNYRSDVNIYDSLGNVYPASTYYIKTADNNWDAQIVVNDVNIGAGTLVFNSDGSLSAAAGFAGLSFNPTNGAASPQTFDISLGNSTQFSGSNSSNSPTQNGMASGAFSGLSIDSNGNVMASYSNGLNRVEGQIAVAKFRAPQGLMQTDNMSWLASSESGGAIVNPDYSQNAIQGKSLEFSNVDLSEELVKLIAAQHDFQANAQVQQTYNQVLQTIENL